MSYLHINNEAAAIITDHRHQRQQKGLIGCQAVEAHKLFGVQEGYRVKCRFV